MDSEKLRAVQDVSTELIAWAELLQAHPAVTAVIFLLIGITIREITGVAEILTIFLRNLLLGERRKYKGDKND